MSSAGTSVSPRLADIVGAEHVISDPARLASYEVDGKRPAAAIQAGSAAEVAEIVKFASAEKLAIVPCGARTKLGIGLPPLRYDLALDLTRLDRVVAYDPGDLTLSVEAGVRLGALAQTLSAHRQFLPLAAPFLNQTTIGGLIASGVDSPLRQFYGTARDFLLGLEFVTGEGITAKSGGRVVKNVTGYDLHKLMIGALGALGIITRLNFKTFPMPLHSRGFVARFPTAAPAFDLRNRITRSALTPLTLEIFSPHVAELFKNKAAADCDPEPMPAGVLSATEWTLSTGYAGNDQVLERFAVDLQRMAEEAGATGSAVLGDNLQPAWTRKREFIPIALASSPAAVIFKISVLPARMAEILAVAQQAAEVNALPRAVMARGVGIIYFAVLPAERNEETRQRVSYVAGAIHAACANLQGHSTVPWCPSEWKTSLQIWGPPRPDAALMQKLKQVFDPLNILSPGRFA
jgi:glycolate oxidase FAD binding subunit